MCFLKVKLSVKVKLFVSLLCVCAILPAKAVPKMTYAVLGETLNPTRSLTHELFQLNDQNGEIIFTGYMCVVLAANE